MTCGSGMLFRLRFYALAVVAVVMLLSSVVHDAGRVRAQQADSAQICASSTVNIPSTETGLRSDCVLLLDIRDTLQGTVPQGGTAPLNWGGSVAFDSWTGITASGASGSQRVTNLSLILKKLTGSIPSELCGLSGLTRLDLAGNELTGSIPSELGQLAALTWLALNQNQLTGPIPSELGRLSSLTYLHLPLNQLTGAIPSELGSLSRLTHLNISLNDLEGSIPSELGRLSNLRALSLQSNQLSGPIPSELANLSNLWWLLLADNRLSGTIPPELGRLTNLRELQFYDNQLSGEIPDLRALTSLGRLDLSDNRLTGVIPSWLGDLSELFLLYLDGNRLTGSIPAQLGDSEELWYVDLSHNQLTGSIPSELGSLTTLRRLLLNDNQLTGSIPMQLGSLTNLDYLYLHGNQLRGLVPDLNGLTSLTGLGLGGNDFELAWSMFETNGEVFDLETQRTDSAGEVVSMLYLYLHGIGLEGPIPAWLAANNPGLIELTVSGVTAFRTGDNSYAVNITPPQGSAQPKVALSTVEAEDVRLHLPPHPSISSVVRIVAAVDIEVFDDFTPPAVVCVPVHDSEAQALEDDQELVLLHEFQDGVWRVLESSDPPSGYAPGAGNTAVCGLTDSFSLFGVAVVEYLAVGTGAIQRISRIEPSIRDVRVSQGDTIRLSFDIYGRQDILNNDLGEGHVFTWDDGRAGGSIRGTDRVNEIIYTAPESPGTHVVTVDVA